MPKSWTILMWMFNRTYGYYKFLLQSIMKTILKSKPLLQIQGPFNEFTINLILFMSEFVCVCVLKLKSLQNRLDLFVKCCEIKLEIIMSCHTLQMYVILTLYLSISLYGSGVLVRWKLLSNKIIKDYGIIVACTLSLFKKTNADCFNRKSLKHDGSRGVLWYLVLIEPELFFSVKAQIIL